MSPSKEDLEAARGRTIPDVLGADLDVVFVGINPGLWSGAVGHHFARPGNRFWKALHGSGFTDRLLSPLEDASLLERDLGLTNLVARTTATAAELAADEIRAGARDSRIGSSLCIPGSSPCSGSARTGRGSVDATRRSDRRKMISAVRGSWVLPNPSGLNAHYQSGELTKRFGALRDSVSPAPRSCPEQR